MSFGPHRGLALTARLSFLEALIKGVEAVVHGCVDGARQAVSELHTDPGVYQRKRDLMMELMRLNSAWLTALERPLHDALRDLRVGRTVGVRAALGPANKTDIPLSLLDDSDVERDLAVTRLAQMIGDHNGSEFSDLNARLQAVGGPVSVSTSGPVDVLMPHWVARLMIDAWLEVGLNLDHWVELKAILLHEVAPWTQEAYHHVNGVLLEHGVRPEIDLRPFIRRAKDVGVTLATPLSPLGGVMGGPSAGPATGPGGGVRGNSGLQPLGAPYEETRMLTQTPGMGHGAAKAQNVLDKLTQVVARQVPGFEPTAVRSAQGGAPAVALSAGLGQAIRAVGDTLRRQAGAEAGGGSSPAEALQALQQNRQALKEAAATPNERAIIEIVALLFQAILIEERLPASIRVWFARLQMPVLRVAVVEPDFFATVSHPARILIDRMGSCVMGFVGEMGEKTDDALHKEIRRVVQVIEAYPDTGRRVFQTVLTEFERFLETYFRDENQASRRGVSLAQQIEQRETCAIQYTIELRKMLDGVPVHDGVREFMFHVWADVLAHSAVVSGPTSDATKALQRAAADLIWSASAKTSREERAEVLRRLPNLLKAVREGMARSGLSVDKQDGQIKELNSALAAAFSARSAAISASHLQSLTERLEALGDVLPDLSKVELDEATLRDLSGHESDALEIVAEGGTMPTPAMKAWARELQIGAWFELDYRGSQEPVQLAWSGLQQQLLLFVTPAGRGILFQLHRLAAFLQAGLLVPQEDESLTTRATRVALAKIDADPTRLLN